MKQGHVYNEHGVKIAEPCYNRFHMTCTRCLFCIRCKYCKCTNESIKSDKKKKLRDKAQVAVDRAWEKMTG